MGGSGEMIFAWRAHSHEALTFAMSLPAFSTTISGRDSMEFRSESADPAEFQATLRGADSVVTRLRQQFEDGRYELSKRGGKYDGGPSAGNSTTFLPRRIYLA